MTMPTTSTVAIATTIMIIVKFEDPLSSSPELAFELGRVSDADVDGTMDVMIRAVGEGWSVGKVGVAPAEQSIKSA